ncbi:MAG: C40 family peptidase [Bacteroides sp.]|nr:C40 family peptidase [Bacteroides sp.]
MKSLIKLLFSTLTLMLSLNACQVLEPQVDYQALAKASIRLGIDIAYEDNHDLYLQSAQWLGTPYRVGGTDRQGIDCSGLSRQLYRKVYGERLSRTTKKQYQEARQIYLKDLAEGDLLFFSSPASPKKVAHVGIYLKNNKFIHATTGKGVIISDLGEEYYRKHFLRAGRID